MMRTIFLIVLAAATAEPALAATLRVPKDHKTIQAAIDAARPGDTILVGPGKYPERIRLTPGVILRSDGDDSRGKEGSKRAEATVLDGGGKGGKQPGVVMAEGSTLDGFTVTNVGSYDEAVWKKHFASRGEDLGDEEGAVQAEGTTAAVSVQGVTCTVSGCIVRHNGDVGIGILGKEKAKTSPLITGNLVYRNMGGGIGVAEGAEPIIRGNTCKENLRAGIGCRKANPIITDNVCSQNVRAGIGCREGSKPVVRGNKCYQNRRAGIGIRMEGTAPVVEGNECYENEMAGIGCRDGASPVLRGNVCRKNKMAGIGCRDGARPLIVGNECRDNEMAGIGVQSKAVAVIHKNKCLDNKLVAIGVTEGSTATITDNELSRTGGQPPIVAVKDGSAATIRDNRITGGGVAAVLVQGKATLSGNTFVGIGGKQGNAVWAWEKSTATISDNTFDGYRAAVNATKAAVVVTGNTIRQFQGTAILVKDSQKPAHVHGNTATSADPKAKVADVQGPSGIVEENVLKKTASLGPGDHARMLLMGELKRTYLVHVPKCYDPKKPTPVVLALHGAAMNGSMMVWFSGLSKKADEAGFVVVYPSGTFLTWNAGLAWGKGGKADDVAFIGKVLDDLATVVKVDEQRVYACGMSNGAMMCYRLAAELSDRIAAVAPVAGTIAIDESRPKRPVPVIHFHGTRDTFVPFEAKGRAKSFMKLKGVEDSIRTWVKLNGCDEKPKDETLSNDDEMKVTRKTYGKGKDGAEVVLVVIEGGGHTWPGMKPPASFMGKSAMNVSANDLMWDFFQKHTLK